MQASFIACHNRSGFFLSDTLKKIGRAAARLITRSLGKSKITFRAPPDEAAPLER
jgi:hypothetical protein